MRLYIRIVALVVVGLAAGITFWLVLQRFVFYGHRKPMTIEYASWPRSKEAMPLYYTFFYRSDGVHVEAYRYSRSYDGPLPVTRIIDFPNENRRVSVDITRNLISSSVVPATAEAGNLRPPSLFDTAWACRAEMAVLLPGGTDTKCERSSTKYLGFPVWKASTRLNRPPHQVVMELLLAPALDWRVLQRIMRDGDGTALGTVKAVRVTKGEPDRSLFEVPQTAKSVSAKEFYSHNGGGRSSDAR